MWISFSGWRFGAYVKIRWVENQNKTQWTDGWTNKRWEKKKLYLTFIAFPLPAHSLLYFSSATIASQAVAVVMDAIFAIEKLHEEKTQFQLTEKTEYNIFLLNCYWSFNSNKIKFSLAEHVANYFFFSLSLSLYICCSFIRLFVVLYMCVRPTCITSKNPFVCITQIPFCSAFVSHSLSLSSSSFFLCRSYHKWDLIIDTVVWTW